MMTRALTCADWVAEVLCSGPDVVGGEVDGDGVVGDGDGVVGDGDGDTDCVGFTVGVGVGVG